MIHIATVHWQSDKWIQVQYKFLKNHIHGNFKLYGFLNEIENDYSSLFHYISKEPIINHAIKLNILADIIVMNASHDNDLIIFIDGDAFPIADIESILLNLLDEYPLIAIKRMENNGDIQPHPSFCATTVGFWKQIKGDWKSGYHWKNSQGEMITDVGGNLLRSLQVRKINWHPLLRTNSTKLHPLMFGIYGNLIYHHGFGFRSLARGGRIYQFLNNRKKIANRLDSRIMARLPDHYFRKFKEKYDPLKKLDMKMYNKYQPMAESIFFEIMNNDHFFQDHSI